MFSATCILYSTSVTAMVASGFHEVRWTLLFIICLTQLMTQSRVVARVGTVTLALWLTSTTIEAATLLQLAHWLTSRAQRGSCPQIILCSPLFGFFWRVCDYAEIYIQKHPRMKFFHLSDMQSVDVVPMYAKHFHSTFKWDFGENNPLPICLLVHLPAVSYPS